MGNVGLQINNDTKGLRFDSLSLYLINLQYTESVPTCYSQK